MDTIIPMVLIILGCCAVTIYVLTIALRDATRRISGMNERLMILVGTKDGNDSAARALVALSKPPIKKLSGVAQEGKSAVKPEGQIDVTVGLG